MFIRHPPERLLSAYRNKIEHPLVADLEEQSIWDEVKFKILDSYRMTFRAFKEKKKRKQKEESSTPTFAEFIHFLYDSDPALMNEHYKPMVELCQPCAVKYDYVGNFATLRRDADAVLGHLKINSSTFWDRGKHTSSPTAAFVRDYYRNLSPVDFRRLEEKFGDDIALYSHLFPFEDDAGYSQVKKRIWQSL